MLAEHTYSISTKQLFIRFSNIVFVEKEKKVYVHYSLSQPRARAPSTVIIFSARRLIIMRNENIYKFLLMAHVTRRLFHFFCFAFFLILSLIRLALRRNGKRFFRSNVRDTRGLTTFDIPGRIWNATRRRAYTEWRLSSWTFSTKSRTI